MGIKRKNHSPWKTQTYVIKALLKREVITRFGKYKLGALWILVDPLVSVIVLGVIMGAIRGQSMESIPYAFFLLSGFLLLSLFADPLNSAMHAIEANQGLLVFKQLQPIDPFIARFLFALFSTVLALLIFCLISAWIGISISTDHLGKLAVSLLLTWLCGCGLGLTLAISSMKIKELEKISAYIQRPLIFISAVFLPIDDTPPEFAKYLLYNPLIHTVEYTRMCLFPSYHSSSVNLYYPAVFALISIALGLMNYRNNRHFLTQR